MRVLVPLVLACVASRTCTVRTISSEIPPSLRLGGADAISQRAEYAEMQKRRCKDEEAAAGQSHARTHTHTQAPLVSGASASHLACLAQAWVVVLSAVRGLAMPALTPIAA
jgi:hypothetical protein